VTKRPPVGKKSGCHQNSLPLATISTGTVVWVQDLLNRKITPVEMEQLCLALRDLTDRRLQAGQRH
jgi:hypothetical protein